MRFVCNRISAFLLALSLSRSNNALHQPSTNLALKDVTALYFLIYDVTTFECRILISKPILFHNMRTNNSGLHGVTNLWDGKDFLLYI